MKTCLVVELGIRRGRLLLAWPMTVLIINPYQVLGEDHHQSNQLLLRYLLQIPYPSKAADSTDQQNKPGNGIGRQTKWATFNLAIRDGLLSPHYGEKKTGLHDELDRVVE